MGKRVVFFLRILYCVLLISGFTINEQILTIFQLVPDGRATEAHSTPGAASHFRERYISLKNVEDLLELTSQIAEQHSLLPVLELPEDTATPSDTEEGNKKKICPFVGKRTKGKRRGFQL